MLSIPIGPTMNNRPRDEHALVVELAHLRREVQDLETAKALCRRAEAELQRALRQNELLLTSAGEGIYGVDAQGLTTFVNPAASAMLGWEPEELIGEPHHALIHHTRADGSPYPAEACPIYAAYRDGAVHRGDEELFWRKDGTSFPVAYTSTPIEENGHLLGAVATFRDITRQKEAQTALQKANAELKASNEALDTYAHTVAHELKNFLSRVVGYAELLEHDLNQLNEDQIKQAAHLIAENGYQMASTTDAMLLLAQVRKQEEIKVAPLDMATLVGNARQQLAPLIEKHQAQIKIPETWPPALGYAPWVEKVWVNYLSNAIKYGGTPPRITLGGRVKNHHARFWVRDNGPGMTQEEQTALFTPFKRIYRGHAKGHGLGLSIVRRIVTRLNGAVGVESSPGGGSTFWFTLPLPSS
jgi:PAS domain S-box-containing protein